MRRREFMSLLGGAAAAWPLAARAQQSGHMRRISVLNGLTAEDSQSQARNAALQGLGVGAHRNSSTRLSPYVRWSNGIWAPCSSAEVSDDESMFPQSRIINC